MNNSLKILDSSFVNFKFSYKKIVISLLILLYNFFCYQMLIITLQYIPYNTDVAFLRIKQDVIDIPFYKITFFTHVYTAIFVLVAGFTQFSIYIRKHFRELHRYSGWNTEAAVYALTARMAGAGGFWVI